MKARTQTTIAALFLVSACTEWVHVETPHEALMKAKAGTIQVTKNDRTVLQLHDATILGDSLVGMTDRDGFLTGALLKDVTAVDVRQFSPRRTGMLVVGGVIATFVTGLILYATSGGPQLIGQ